MNFNKNIFSRFFSIFAMSLLVLALVGCVKTEFDEPPIQEIPVGELISIQELRDMFVFEPISFDEDISITGIVTMDGTSGNIYRGAFIEDNTAGINLRLMSPGGLFEGDSIRINLKGSVLSSYREMIQLDSLDIDEKAVKIQTLTPKEPRLTSIENIIANPDYYQARLVKLEDVQFLRRERGKTFADKENLLTQNRTLQDCPGDTIIVRTSGYAAFADTPVPENNGSLVAIVSQYGNTIQLFLRNIDEVVFDQERCEFQDDFLDQVLIKDARESFAEGNTQFDPATKLQGVVIASDYNEGNFNANSITIMDESERGIVVLFENAHDFAPGEYVRINVSGQNMLRIAGLLTVVSVPNQLAGSLGEEDQPDPEVVTIDQLLGNVERYESVLVKINNATLSGGSTFGPSFGGGLGRRTITDASGFMEVVTRADASLASESLPSGSNNIVAVFTKDPNGVSVLMLRNINDVQ